MKRCPQCEFIYEDEQSLCDMDGALLVLDSLTLPHLHELATIDVPVPRRAVWRHRTFPAMAALILATVFSLVYFVTTQRGVQSAAPAADAAITTDINPLPIPSDSNIVPPTVVNGAAAITAEEATPAAPEPEPTKAPAPAVAKKASAVKSPATETRTEEPKKKEENKVGSIIKKTGRILKKPFKF